MQSSKGGSGQTRSLERNQHDAPNDQTGKRPGDARDEPEQQERNREEMGVNRDHKTQDMERRKRGTFP
ncbi:MAG TPA: hypothetical protein VFB54_15850 [Burkholderiales bacterium]|nr:hypothetical protein [Burkholderiales bacterium]